METNKYFLPAAVILAGLLIAGAVMWNGSHPAAPGAPEEPLTGTAPEPGVGPTLGNKDATVTIVEFTDFQCPFCSRHFTETFGQIKQNYVDTGKVKYESRNLPLSNIHPFAQITAEAAMCADKQSKYWEMHDKLFVDQKTWSSSSDAVPFLKKYSADLGLNTMQFNRCLDNHETANAVQQDAAAATIAGITGTPGFWIIGPNSQRKLSGAYPYADFKEAIDAVLK